MLCIAATRNLSLSTHLFGSALRPNNVSNSDLSSITASVCYRDCDFFRTMLISMPLLLRKVSAPFLLLALFSAFGIPSAAAESWTDVSGTHTIEADFVGIWNGRVILQLTGGEGRRVAVEMNRLNAASRLRAQELQRERAEWRSRRMEEIRAAAKAAAEAKARAAAVPPRPEIEYAPPPVDADLEAFVSHVQTQQKAGHIVLVSWDALPPSYQTDLQNVVRAFGEKVDPQIWSSILSVLGKVEQLATEKQEMIAALPMIQTVAMMKGVDAELIVGPATQLVAIVFDPERLSKQNLQQIDIGAAVTELNDELAEPSYRLRAALSKVAGVDESEVQNELEYTVEQTAADQGTLTITNPDGTTKSEAMVKVEGKWMPQSLVDGWKARIATANEAIGKLGTSEDPMKPAVEQLAPLSQFLDDLLAAETQTEFNGIVQALMGKLMQFAPAGGMGLTPPGSAPPQ